MEEDDTNYIGSTIYIYIYIYIYVYIYICMYILNMHTYILYIYIYVYIYIYIYIYTDYIYIYNLAELFYNKADLLNPVHLQEWSRYSTVPIHCFAPLVDPGTHNWFVQRAGIRGI